MQPIQSVGGFVVELLENRTLLSAGGLPFPGFGTGGQLAGYAVLAARNDGSLIAENEQNKLVVLHPDGTFASNYGGSTPQTIPVQNVQSDGKYLIVKNGALTRYNKNGTIDKTFGKNGIVSNFYVAQPYVMSGSYQAQAVCVDGTKIFVSGVEQYVAIDGTQYSQSFVEHLTSSGKVDAGFGDHGLAPTQNPIDYSPVFFMEVGPDHNLYVAGDSDSDPVVDRYSESGKFQGEAEQDGNTEGETVGGIAFQGNGKILILTKSKESSMSLTRYNADMIVDTSFGEGGTVDAADDGEGDEETFALSLRADGAAFISFNVEGGDYNGTYAYTTQPRASAISGHFFNDANGNGKRDPGEAPLPYWAAYVDANNDGVWEPGEPIAYADAQGYYKFYNFAPGTYVIREVRQSGWTRTAPAGAWPAGDYKVTLGVNQLVGLRDFGNRR